MGRPPIDRRPNELLAHWLTRAGMSNVELARAITTRAAEAGERGIGTDESRVRRWLKGETPRAPVPQLICDIISEHLGTPLTCADLVRSLGLVSVVVSVGRAGPGMGCYGAGQWVFTGGQAAVMR